MKDQSQTDPTQEKKTDADIMEGGPAPEITPDVTEAAAPVADDLVEMRLNGKTVRVPRDAADAFRYEINSRDGRLGGELQALRDQLARLTMPAQPAAPKEPELAAPNPDLMITDPGEYQKQFVTYTQEIQARKLRELETQYRAQSEQERAEQARVAAWTRHVDNFYAANPDLAKAQDVVEAVWQRDQQELAPLKLEEGLSELANRARARVLELASVGKGITSKPPALVSSRVRGGAQATPKDEGPNSMTDYLRQRRQAREAAR